MTSRLPTVAAASAITVTAALGLAGCSTDSAGPSAPTTSSATSPSSAASPGSPSSRADENYRDGTYTAKGWYGGGPSSIDVQVTLQDDKVTNVKVTPNATNETSLDFQNRFANAVGAEVVGRDIQGLSVGRLAGSSSTPAGFNDALTKIRGQARA